MPDNFRNLLQQAIGYAKALDAPFVFSSNGDAFPFHDRNGRSSPVERQIGLDAAPSPLDGFSPR